VRRAFAGVDLSALDPFVHMDQMGEVDASNKASQHHTLHRVTSKPSACSAAWI
jgi:hypothetical protein